MSSSVTFVSALWWSKVSEVHCFAIVFWILCRSASKRKTYFSSVLGPSWQWQIGVNLCYERMHDADWTATKHFDYHTTLALCMILDFISRCCCPRGFSRNNLPVLVLRPQSPRKLSKTLHSAIPRPCSHTFSSCQHHWTLLNGFKFINLH